jgi:hypothetical protein
MGGRDQPQVAANPNAPTESWRRSDDARDNNDKGDDGDGKGERIKDAGSAESASLYTDFIDKHACACNNNNNNNSHNIMDRNNPPPWLTPHAHGLKLATTTTTTAVPQLCMCCNIPTAAASLTLHQQQEQHSHLTKSCCLVCMKLFDRIDLGRKDRMRTRK